MIKVNPTTQVNEPHSKSLLSRSVTVVGYGLLIGMPFHATLVIWLGSVFGGQAVLSLWKELIIAWIVLAAIVMSFKQGFRWLLRPVNIALMCAIGFGFIGLWLTARADTSVLVGIKTTVFPWLLCLAIQPFASQFKWMNIRSIILITALAVSSLAILQFLVIPTLFLQSIGYNSTTIIPFQGIQPGVDFGRSFATLGGPNQLGAFLILPAVWSLTIAISNKNRKRRYQASIIFTFIVLAMVTTFSRSAWVGLAVAGLVVIIRAVPKSWRVLVSGIATASLLIGWKIADYLISSTTGLYRQLLLRGEITAAGVIGSDEGHIIAFQSGIAKSLQHPLGLGYGAAGPASKYGSGFITENWYLQLVLELGWFGGISWCIAVGFLIRSWWKDMSHEATVLLATMSGLLVTNLFLHTFADSSLAITWWLIVGIYIGMQKVHHSKKLREKI